MCCAVDHERHRLSHSIIYSILTKQQVLQYIIKTIYQLSLIHKILIYMLPPPCHLNNRRINEKENANLCMPICTVSCPHAAN